jgi:hypothetical protein
VFRVVFSTDFEVDPKLYKHYLTKHLILFASFASKSVPNLWRYLTHHHDASCKIMLRHCVSLLSGCFLLKFSLIFRPFRPF